LSSHRLASSRFEPMIAALQDLDPKLGRIVRGALTKRISEGLIRLLRSRVGTNHPNKGNDIIDRVHDELFTVMLDPKSNEGRAYRSAFGLYVNYRIKDAIIMERQHSHIPVQAKVRKPAGGTSNKSRQVGEPIADLMPNEDCHKSDIHETFEDAEASETNSNRDLTLLNGVRDSDEQLDVDRLLRLVQDDQKRLAFYLHMDGVPFGSTKGHSIAKAIGKSSKTARKWVEEVQQLLQANEEVQELRQSRTGDKK
jgi:hypothetical protein